MQRVILKMKNIYILLLLLLVGCTAPTKYHYTPTSYSKEQIYSYVGSFSDFKYNYFHLDLADNVYLDIDIESNEKDEFNFQVDFYLKKNASVQLKSNKIVILDLENDKQFEAIIRGFSLGVHGVNGYVINKKPLDKLVGKDLNKAPDVPKIYHKDKFRVKIYLQMDGAPNKVKIIFPTVYVNEKEVIIEPIIMNKKKVEKKFLGIF